ncbi:Sulfate transporter 1.3 [Capsicum chinense]|nr:Sulfate transporter 1.3 [Capsicum chinense]
MSYSCCVTLLRNKIDPTINPTEYLRLDFLINFLSQAVVGFMGGAAITIALQQLKGDYLIKGIRTGIEAGMIAFTEVVAIGRTFASMKHYQLEGNKEMVALGAMNIIGSLTSCYVATVLAAIIISVVIGLIAYEAAILIWKIDKFDFVACIGAYFGVVFASHS